MINKNFISNVYLKKLIDNIKKKKNYNEKPENYFSYFENDIIKNRSFKEIKELIEGLIISGMLHYTSNNHILEIYSDSDKTDKIYSIKLVENLKESEMKIGKFEDFDVIKYSKENNLDFAIITDAVNWRIYNLKEINYYDNYIEIDITSYLLNQDFSDDILFLCEFLDVNNFFKENKEDIREIDKIFSESSKEIETIEKNIKSVIEPILTDISNGFINSIGKTTYNDKERREIYIDSIVLLYRILFVLYAESRELFPTTSEAYQKASLTQLIEKSKELFETEKLIGIENDFTLYDKFDRLVKWIDGGGQEIGITAYNRGLFRNTDKPILRNFKLKNKYFAEVILKLGYFQNNNGDYTEKIDYKDLTVRNLGTFYEGILEYNLFIAEEELVKRSTKGKVEFIKTSETTVRRTEQGNIIKKGEVYLSQDKGERKETGAYYTPEPIVEYIVSNTVDKKLEELKSKIIEDIEKIDSEIKNAISDRDIRILNRSKLDLILEFINNKVLKLSVLDNAMGSGHFLVNAALHISNFIMELVYENVNFEIEDEEYEEIGNYNYWKRMVITHCIYGVDINELAVQLGKLSLWLVSASKDKPLSFLDHHLKCGNSLLGTNKKDIEITLESGLGDVRSLFDTTLNTIVGRLHTMYEKLSKMPEDTAEEVHMKEENYDEIVGELEVVKAKFDLYLNMQIEDKKGEVEKGLFEDIAKSSIEDISNREIHKFEERMKFAKENKFFHWELEFPEVFRGDNGGFDCVIGNPPYGAGYLNIFKKFFQNFYRSAQTDKIENIKGSVDTFSLFVDKSIVSLRNSSYFAYIVPLAITSSESMIALHKMIFEVCETVSVSTYSNRPKKIFTNADQRVSIILAYRNNKPLKNLYTTKVNKRYENTSINELIKNMSFIKSDEFILQGRLPKVGSKIERDILKKLFSIKTNIGLIIKGEGLPIYYRSAGGRYYNIVTNYSTGSSAEKNLMINIKYVNIVGAILSSTLYYWFYHSYSDTLNVKAYELEIFPFPIDNFSNEDIIKIEKIYEEYLVDLEKNASIINANYSKVNSFKEYKARKSKHIIDKIDRAIQNAYGLNDEEIDFIINYDIEFRTDSEK